MNERLRGLLRRLSAPLLSARLSKEELCLSMAAVARLRLRHSELSTLSLDTLATRALRVSHACAPRELGMLAEGAAVLGLTRRADLADALIADLHTALNSNNNKNNNAIRVSDLAAVLLFASAVHSYGNVTAGAIVRTAASRLAPSDGRGALEAIVCAARVFLSPEECRAVLDAMRAAATDEQSAFIAAAAAAAAPVAFRTKATDMTESSLLTDMADVAEPSEASDVAEAGALEDSEGSAWTAPRARRWLLAFAPAEPRGPRDAAHALHLYAHFRLVDPLLCARLEDAALSAMPHADEAARDEMQRAIGAAPHLFPRVRSALSNVGNVGTGANVGTALQRCGAAAAAYAATVAGRRVPDAWLLDVMREAEGHAPPDTAAQAACVFAERGEVPEGVVVQLCTRARALTAAGVAAFVRAARRDPSGAMFDASIARVAEESSWDVGALLALCAALALPAGTEGTTERTAGTSPMNGAESAAAGGPSGVDAEALVTRLLELLREAPLPLLCEAAKAARPIDAQGDVLRFLSSRAVSLSLSSPQGIGVDDALLLLDVLRSRDAIDEPLLDAILPPLRGLAETVAARLSDASSNSNSNSNSNDSNSNNNNNSSSSSSSGDCNGSSTEALDAGRAGRFASLQSALDAPELDAAALRFARAVASAARHAAPGAVPGAALLLARCGRHAEARRAAEALEGRAVCLSSAALADAGRMCAAVAGAEALAAEVVAAIAARCGAAEGAEVRIGEQRPPVEPDAVAVAVAALWRGGGGAQLPRAVAALLREWAPAIGAEAYAALCQAAANAPPHDAAAGALIDALAEDFPRRVGLLSCEQMANVAFGLGEVHGMGERLSHQLIAEKCSDYAINHVEEFWSGRDISRLLYGFSRMQCTKRSLYNVFATRLARRPILLSMDHEAMSLAVAAFGRAKYLDKKLFDAFSKRLIERAADLNAADLLLNIRGFSRVMLLDHKLYNYLGDRAVLKAGDFPLESKCVLLDSFGSMSIEHETLANEMLDGIVNKMDELGDANKAVNVIASVWQMNHPVEDDKRVARLAELVVERSDTLNNASITKLCAVLSDRNWRNVSLVKAIADQSVRLREHDGVSAECCRMVLDTLGRFMVHHKGARENLSLLGRTVSKERIQLSEEEEQQLQLLLRR